MKDWGTAAYGIEIEGNPQKPEPDTCLVFFPGGCVEITRTTTGKYWIHVGAFTDDSGLLDVNNERLDGRRKGRIVEGLYNAKNISPGCGVGAMEENFKPTPKTFCMKVLVEPES